MSIYFGELEILQIEGWLKNNEPFGGIMSCGKIQFYGPFFEFDVIQLNSIISIDHTEIRIRFKLIVVEYGGMGSLKIQVNNEQQIHFPNYTINNLNLICGNSQTITVIDAQFLHNVPNLLISITTLLLDLRSSQQFELFMLLSFVIYKSSIYNI